ncbi:ABC transporter ATP-binding protein [Nakamurella sp. GG22]
MSTQQAAPLPTGQRPETAPVNALTVAGVHKSFNGVPVLRGVGLDVADGGITAILGPSGCGKTTLLRLVAGFLRPDAGSIHISGQQVSGPAGHVPPEERRLGYLAQEGALFPHLSVAQNIAFGLPRRERKDRARLYRLLQLVSLDRALADRFPHELSGGQQQRVALARTLAPEPRLVLLDEPFSALDASLRTETRSLVAAALAAAGVTTLLVTHDQAEALSFADQIAIMRSGVLAQVGDPRQVYDEPVDLPTAEFIGDTCTVPGFVAGSAAHGPLGDLAIRHPVGADRFDGPALLMLRPEQLQIRTEPPAGTPGVRAVVSSVEYFGHDCVVTAELPGDPQTPGTSVTCRLLGGERLAAGSTVAISVSGAALAYPMKPAPGTG